MEFLISIAILIIGWRLVFYWERKAGKDKNQGYPKVYKMKRKDVVLDETEKSISE